jgi:hypothetical protein
MATAVKVGWTAGGVTAAAVMGGVGGVMNRGTVARGMVVGTAGEVQAERKREKKEKKKQREEKLRFTFYLSRCILDSGGKRNNHVRRRPTEPKLIHQPRTKPGRV